MSIFSGFVVTQPGRKPKKSVVNSLPDEKKTYVTRKTKIKPGSRGNLWLRYVETWSSASNCVSEMQTLLIQFCYISVEVYMP